MPIGQNLLALFNADFSRDALPALAAGKAISADPDAVAAFSAILAEQTPADLDALTGGNFSKRIRMGSGN